MVRRAGRLNVSANCLDRHVDAGRGERVAFHWEGEDGSRRELSYAELLEETQRFANALRSLGVGKGDVVGIFMPMVPEAAVAMLACARIGAIHNVVFGGFSAKSVAERMEVSGAKALVTADATLRRGEPVPMKPAVDEVLDGLAGARARDRGRPLRHRPADDARAATSSGTTRRRRRRPSARPSRWTPRTRCSSSTRRARPRSRRGSCTRPAGYLTGVSATHKLVFDLKDDDVYWCAADIGWITGHSYIVYGPLANGATSVMYEGAPNYPAEDRWWEIVERYGVTILYTAPTAIRACMKWGAEHPRQARPLIAAPARHGRRADQPARLALVPREDRRRALPDRRHLVADRDRRDHDHAAARA